MMVAPSSMQSLGEQPPFSMSASVRSFDQEVKSDTFSDCDSDATSGSGNDCLEDDQAALDALAKKKKGEDFAKNENRAVSCGRLIMLLVLAGAAIGVSIAVHNYLSREEERQFQEQFDSDAEKLLDSIAGTLENTLGPADSMVVNLVAYANAVAGLPGQRSFPFVTLPNYGLQLSKFLRTTKAVQANMKFVVQEDQEEEWEEYADSMLTELEEAIRIMDGDPDWTGPINYDYKRCYEIATWGGIPLMQPTNYTRTYIPDWQQFPAALSTVDCPYNFDAWQSPDVAQGLLYMMGTQQGIIGNFPGVNFNVSDPAQAFAKEQFEEFVGSLAPQGFSKEEPLTQIALPIFDTLDSVYIDITQPQKFVGYMSISVFFRSLIENLLPEDSNGMIIVLDQLACGAPFTYRLDGQEATYLGIGDQHETKYDDMVHSQIWEEMANSEKSGRKSSYSGVPISTEFCPNLLKIYPSSDREASFKTSNPTIMGIVAGCIFVFTSIVFIIFDCLVQRRQKTVMRRAIESGAIVSSLFPDDVAQKLYEEHHQKTEREEQAARFEVASTGAGVESAVEHPAAGLKSQQLGEQIAKLYPETTVLFADIAGFTKWSSSRQPSEVFSLLETLYGAFDILARRRRVFKVETIGDCYLAITGCPNPQENHAVIMVRFSRDCLTTMNVLLADLVETLGDDTADLNFRVGLHSGPVTAGVLRGEKARFQLFGDTVNTCARIESTGLKGRIHASQATADALIQAGKEGWLTPRENKVFAKGKGELTTYWVNPRGGNGSVGTTQSSSDFFSADGSTHSNVAWHVLDGSSMGDSVADNQSTGDIKSMAEDFSERIGDDDDDLNSGEMNGNSSASKMEAFQ